jgi:hypothetical protein
MPRYLILDEVDTPQRFPLSLLLDSVARERTVEMGWIVTRSRGFGRQVTLMDDALEFSDGIVLSHSFLTDLAAKGQQWFYNLDACLMGDPTVRIGVFDSSYLYLEEPEHDLGARIVGDFRQYVVQ